MIKNNDEIIYHHTKYEKKCSSQKNYCIIYGEECTYDLLINSQQKIYPLYSTFLSTLKSNLNSFYTTVILEALPRTIFNSPPTNNYFHTVNT